jgi:hypothetical protein
MAEVVQRENEAETHPHRGGAAQRDGAVDDPVVGVHDMWPFLAGDAGQFADAERIWQWRVMGTAGRVDTREAHRSRAEPVHPDPGAEGFLIRNAGHALRRHGNLVPPLGQGVRQVEEVALLAADVGGKELGQQEDAHQRAPGGAISFR